MEQFVGLDVSLAETSLCVVDSHVAAPPTSDITRSARLRARATAGKSQVRNLSSPLWVRGKPGRRVKGREKLSLMR